MKILYFASLKEKLGKSEESINLLEGTTITQLKTILSEKYDFPVNILCAVNYEIANNDLVLKDTDEVAFYPPVTGG
jgi:molybdopterin synthase sulfur carrier subunit